MDTTYEHRLPYRDEYKRRYEQRKNYIYNDLSVVKSIETLSNRDQYYSHYTMWSKWQLPFAMFAMSFAVGSVPLYLINRRLAPITCTLYGITCALVSVSTRKSQATPLVCLIEDPDWREVMLADVDGRIAPQIEAEWHKVYTSRIHPQSVQEFRLQHPVSPMQDAMTVMQANIHPGDPIPEEFFHNALPETVTKRMRELPVAPVSYTPPKSPSNHPVVIDRLPEAEEARRKREMAAKSQSL